MAGFRQWTPRRAARKRSSRIAGCALAASLLVLAIASNSGADPVGSASGPPPYTIMNLDAFGPADQGGIFTPSAINAAGAVAGYANAWWDSEAPAALFDSTGMHDLLALGTPRMIFGDISEALALNNQGQVVGYCILASPEAAHAFLYSDGVMHDLGAVFGESSSAVAINNSGAIVGTGAANLLWANGTTTDLGSFTPGAINDAGQIAGTLPSGHVAIWQNGTVQDIGVLPGYSGSAVHGINATGQVVGWADRPLPLGGGVSHAFFYDGSTMHDLGTLGGSYSQAEGINAAGQIVGWAFTTANTSQTRHAFLDSGGVMTDLNDLLPANSGWVLSDARAINDAGQIAGTGTLNGQFHSFLMTRGVDPRSVPPAAPSGLSVRMVSTSELDLTWTDNSNNENSFEVQVEDPGNTTNPWRDIGTVPANTTTFASTGLQSYTHYTYRVRAVNLMGASDWSNEASGDTGFRPLAAISADRSLDFGNQPVGTPSGVPTVTVTNEGNGPLEIHSISVTGSNASEFALVPPVATPQTLAPGASLSMSLVFTPAAWGPRSAAVTIVDNEPRGAATFGLSGFGITPVIQVSPGALDFGRQPVGLGGTLALLLQNTGDAPLIVSSFTFQGPDAAEFSLATDGVTGQTLPPGSIRLLNIRFTPTATGSRSASLVITGGAAGSPQLVPLTGFGTEPLLTLSANSLIFPLQPGSAGSTQTLVITNGGDAPLTVDGLTLAGPNASSFQIVSDTGQKSLDPGASRTLQISFNPAAVAGAPRHAHIAAARIAAVSYSATLEIRDNDPHPGAPHSVTLTAVETAPAAPTNLAATLTPADQVALTWTTNSSSATAFAVWRQTGGGAFVRVGVVAPKTTHFADASVSPNTAYTYEVRAINNSGASAWSNQATAVTLEAPPAAPANLTATVISAGEIDLAWTRGGGDETGIAIFRRTGTGGWQRIRVVAPSTTRYADRSVQPGVSYTYRVRAHNNHFVSAWTNEVSGLTPPAP